MKRYLIVFLVLSCVTVTLGQNISVNTFKLLDTDLTANTAGTMEQDQNGETAALIKVVTTQTGFTFDGGALGIVKTKQTPGEVWVYIPKGAKKISIKHPQLGVLRDYYFPIAIEAARTYEMVLVAGEVQTIVKQARTSQYVVFQLVPPDAVVELDGELLKTEGGVASKMMKFGTYNYRVQAPNYLLEAGSVTIDDPNNKKIVNISLKPNFAQLNISVDNNAEIWINGEKKGVGNWSGNLGAGTYELEAKKAGHRSTLITKDIEVAQEPQNITLQAPVPVYGEADVNSSPGMADIYIDGKKVGQTPQLISDVLVGEHQIVIDKKGYEKVIKTCVIEEGKVSNISIVLSKTDLAKSEVKIPIENTSNLNNDTYTFTDKINTLRSIFKDREYIEAESIIRSLSKQTDTSEKAKAYNKLVDLAYEKFQKEDKIKTTNMVMKKNDPVDVDGLVAAGKIALQAAMECDKYDQQPNERGKVAIKFRQKNQDRLKVVRLSLLQTGIEMANNNDYKGAFESINVYLASAKSSLFDGVDGVSKNDPNLGVAAFYGGRAAYNLEKFDKAIEFFKIGIKDNDKQIHDLSFDFLLYTMRNKQKTAADSAQFITDMLSLYKEYPDAEQIYSSLSDAYISKGMNAEVIKLAEERMAKYPNSSLPHVYKAFLLMQDKKYDEAISEFAKVKEDNSPVYLNSIFNSAVCKYNKASEFNEANSDIRTGRLKPADHDKFMNMLKDAQGDFEKAKELDPEQKTVRWQYLLHNVYTLTDQKDKAAALE